MKQKTKILALISIAPLTAFGLNVGGSVGLESGYRWDEVKYSGANSGINTKVKVDNLNGLTAGLNGRLTLDDIYIRANGAYMWTLSTPITTATNGSNTIEISLEKEYGYDVGGAAGYNFYFNEGEFSLAPEIGFAYSKLYINTNVPESAASPFVGFDFNWMFSTDWKFGFLFDFHFFGFRSSQLLSGGLPPADPVTKGKYMGPEAKIAFDYSFTENWSLGLAYRFKYLFTGKENFGAFTDTKETWMTNNATVKVDYTF